MNILFFNLCNIGDTHFSQPFIENIVKNNINYNFSLYCKFNYIIFSDIDRLEIHKNIDSNLLNYIIKYNNFRYNYNTDLNLIIINTWAGVYKENNYTPDADLVFLTKKYYQCIDNINNEFKLNLKYYIELQLPKLPKLTLIDNTKINDFKNIYANFKLIFYYNYLPMSQQNFPIKSMEEHDEIILNLSQSNENIILVPKLSSRIQYHIILNNIKNIIDCNNYFNLIEDNYCSNIYFYTYLTNYCNFVIYYDSGRSFTYINSNINKSNIKIHIANNDCYYKRLIINNPLIPDNLCKLCICFNKNDIIEKLDKYIKNII